MVREKNWREMYGLSIVVQISATEILEPHTIHTRITTGALWRAATADDPMSTVVSIASIATVPRYYLLKETPLLLQKATHTIHP